MMKSRSDRVNSAIYKGELEQVIEIIESENSKEVNKYALYCASKFGKIEIVKYLAKQSDDLYYHDFAIKLAIEADHLEVVKYLKLVVKMRALEV